MRYDTLKVAKRLEAELGDEQLCFIEGSPSEWDLLPLPDGAFKVGIDGGYVRNWFAKKHNFEVIVGKSTRACGENEADKTPSSKALVLCKRWRPSRNAACMRCCTRKACR